MPGTGIVLVNTVAQYKLCMVNGFMLIRKPQTDVKSSM